MKKRRHYLLLLFFMTLLVCIRAFEKELFYDPFVLYFKNDYLYATMPKIDIWRLLRNLLFRYVLNSSITLAIVYVVFQHKKEVKFAAIFLMIAFILLLPVFVFLLHDEFKSGYLFPFYLRRFLIHPLFLFLLMPAFYYQKLNTQNSY